MKFYEYELNGEIIKLRLTSGDSMLIEKKTGVKLIDFIQDYAITTVITLLMYMRRSDTPNFSEKDAQKLFDKFIDNGLTLQEVLFDIIYEALVISGFLTKGELDEMKEAIKDNSKKQKEQVMKEIQA